MKNLKNKRKTKGLLPVGKLLWAACFMLPFLVYGQNISPHKSGWQGKFEQLGTLLPTPNKYRTAAGTPGPAYWQQKADYRIAVTLDEDQQTISGHETVTLFNHSPQTLHYLWLQLDQNIRQPGGPAWQTDPSYMSKKLEAQELMSITGDYFYEGGINIEAVTDTLDRPLAYTINNTMMRVELPIPLPPGGRASIKVAWHYKVYDRLVVEGRGGYEYFPDDDNYIFTIAQWYPRLAVYDDVEGWQNKQFLGQGEFALNFGDFDVQITVPADHLVAASGELLNADEVLTPTQMTRLARARQDTLNPVIIVSEKEARKKEKTKSKETKTWHFKAANVRDFAFASSRKFIWDAMAVPLATTRPLAMSFYPKEGNPLWERESTRAVANALRTYSRHTFDYPYPVAISIHTAEQGMEYPMICFNGGRPGKNGHYSKWVLQEMVEVIVHEVGHNYFPMIVNSDERQWTWMDEGLNTFLEHLTLAEHYPDFNLTWGTPAGITRYMRGNPDFIRPIMTNSEQIVQFGYNAYGKPSAALLVLREVVMGPQLFDYAFKEYARRWAFKRPMPADFFRTMEDASAVDLDWFWRGWFFTTDYVDVALTDVKWYKIVHQENNNSSASSQTDTTSGNALQQPIPLYLKETSLKAYGEFRNRLDEEALQAAYTGANLYELTFENKGGLPTPLIIEWQYADGSSETEIVPAEIWRFNEQRISKAFYKTKQVVRIHLDPARKTADVDIGNNSYPAVAGVDKFDKFKKKD